MPQQPKNNLDDYVGNCVWCTCGFEWIGMSNIEGLNKNVGALNTKLWKYLEASFLEKTSLFLGGTTATDSLRNQFLWTPQLL